MKRSHKLLSLILTICIAMSMLTGFAPANAVADTTATGRTLRSAEHPALFTLAVILQDPFRESL